MINSKYSDRIKLLNAEENVANGKASKENNDYEVKKNIMREKNMRRHEESDDELGDDEDEDVVYNAAGTSDGIKIELNDSGNESGRRSRHTIVNNKMNQEDKFVKNMYFVKEEEDAGCLKIYKFFLLNISFFLYVSFKIVISNFTKKT